MKRKFNPKDIRISLKLPSILIPLSSILIRMVFLVDYIYTPLFKIFEVIGRSKRLQNINFLPETNSIRLKEVLIELEDGGKLATDIYLPKEIYNEKRTGPTILVRLPYWKDRVRILGYFIASKGYVAVIQEIRGCGRSSEHGTNSLYMYERQDGIETLRWITRRFWYNKKIGMWGLSYLGITTNSLYMYERQDGLETLRWITRRFWYNKKIGMWGLSYLGITQLAVSWNNDNLLACLTPIHCSYSNVFWHPGGLYPVGLSGALYLIMISTAKMKKLTTMDFDQWDRNGYYKQLFFNPSNSFYNEPLAMDTTNNSFSILRIVFITNL